MLALISVVFFSCDKDDSEPPTVPSVTTAPLTNITSSSATTGGTIVDDGGAAITQSGIVLSKTNANPTLADSVIAGTATTGSFTTDITGLEFNNTYYVRAFATNSVGTGYGSALALNTVDDTSKVRFTYNGEEVVYGIIISPTTGKKWLDRNLGAKRAAMAFDDYEAYGDLFQWGRPADGHELMNWTASTTGTAINGMTAVLATSDNPDHNNFIDANSSAAYDWRDDNNNNRWGTAPTGACPAGWHVPTENEWKSEVSAALYSGGTATSGGMIDRSTAYSMLKLTSSGFRRGYGTEVGQFTRTGTEGFYWSSTVRTAIPDYYDSFYASFSSDFIGVDVFERSLAMSIRCVKD